MSTRLSLERPLTYLDAIVAVIMAVGAGWFFYLSREAAAEAVRLYGRNVDSGALEGAAVLVYFVPNIVLFALASIAMWRRWRLRWPAQASAVFWLVVPVVLASVPW